MARHLEDADHRRARFYNETTDDISKRLDELPAAIRTAEFPRYEYGKDYDRILYSSAFRKLGGVTQVVTSREVSVFHNRLTHSLKVAQTGVRIAASLLSEPNSEVNRRRILDHGGLHPAVVRAACLAHDLGHPPFGHIGEYTLQDVATNPHQYLPGYPPSCNGLTDSFEGNAQTFRIVTRLAYRQARIDEIDDSSPEATPPGLALNLTRATLAAISKYPWTRNAPAAQAKDFRKWGAYDTEASLLEWAFQGMSTARETELYGRKHTELRTIEGQVMDWADDIAYAVHDLEDFYRVGLIPLHELAQGADSSFGGGNSGGGEEFRAFTSWAFDKLKDTLPKAQNQQKNAHLSRDLDFEEVLDILLNYKVANVPGVFANAPRHTYDGSRVQRQNMHTFASGLIQKATSGLEVSPDGVVMPKDPETFVVIEMLKKLTEYYVIRRPALGSAQFGQRTVLIELTAALWSWVQESTKDSYDGFDRRPMLEIPRRLNDYFATARFAAENATTAQEPRGPHSSRKQDPTREQVILRGILDYVASLTDDQALVYHQRLCSGTTNSMLDPWLFL